MLSTLQRTHSPGRAELMVSAARGAGFEHVSLDLIYGTPGSRLPNGGTACAGPSIPAPTMFPPMHSPLNPERPWVDRCFQEVFPPR